MKNIITLVKEKPWIGWILYIATIALVFLAGLFGSSIIERRYEYNIRNQMVKPIDEWEPRNEVWGENFPLQYESYLKTLDTNFISKHGGNKEIDMLERYPSLVILWAGYAFSRDFSQAKGHYHAVEDIWSTLRTGVPQPATCWTCKSTDVPRVMNEIGVAEFYAGKWHDLGHEIVNPIGCQDCHDPKTMNLRVVRPALLEAFERQGRNIKDFSHQEMRSLVCAQCHVEYYFDKETNYLIFPWDKGTSVEEVEAYFDEIGHTDFVHALSKAPIIKAQHPDYEVFKLGIHSQRGVSCADCHMPYKSEGGVKFTNHEIVSPLKNIAGSCQVCHRESEATLTKNVYDRQDMVRELADLAEESLVKAHIEAKTAWDNGANEDQMKEILTLIRHSQWRWDFATAGHGNSFHASLEVARILGTAIQKSEEARIKIAALLTGMGVQYPVEMPDLSTKETAQQYLGLDMEKFRGEKKQFIDNVLPEWIKSAEERQGGKIMRY
jgi:nitrite reductase (cytochrome c-552)